MLRMATSPIEGQQNKVCRPGWQCAAPGTAIKNAGVWVVGPNGNNLLDTELLLYEADVCQTACAGGYITSSHTSGKACGGVDNWVIPHIRQKPVAGMDIESSQQKPVAGVNMS